MITYLTVALEAFPMSCRSRVVRSACTLYNILLCDLELCLGLFINYIKVEVEWSKDEWHCQFYIILYSL